MNPLPRRRLKKESAHLSRFAKLRVRVSKFHSDRFTLNANNPGYRAIYLLPNAITTAALFCGFYAIVMAMNLEFERAVIAIFIAMILDGLDGRVARLTHSQSEFGVEYDSLSDMVSFGAAPALVIYEWGLRGLGKIGWVAAFIYCASGALRLARFNTNSTQIDKRFFQGLPSPAAAALISSFVWFMDDLLIAGKTVSWLAWSVTLFAGLSMVSNIPFYSFKDVNPKKIVPFIVIFFIALGMVLISVEPAKALFALFAIYALSGYVIYSWRFYQDKKLRLEEKND